MTDSDIETLKQQEWFDQLDEGALERLLEACDRRTLMTGEALWSRGDRGDAVYLLVDGRVETKRTVQPDGQRTEQIVRGGALLGLPALIHDWEHESSAYPVERTEVLRLTREAFDELFEQRHAVAFRLLDAIAEELVEEVRDANRRMHEVFGHPGETLRMLRRRARESERR